MEHKSNRTLCLPVFQFPLVWSDIDCMGPLKVNRRPIEQHDVLSFHGFGIFQTFCREIGQKLKRHGKHAVFLVLFEVSSVLFCFRPVLHRESKKLNIFRKLFNARHFGLVGKLPAWGMKPSSKSCGDAKTQCVAIFQLPLFWPCFKRFVWGTENN